MGSIYVSWKGTCEERAIQEELVGFLRNLADRSAARLEDPAPRRPAILEMMTAQRDQGMPELECVRMHCEELTGDIILDPYLVCDSMALRADVDEAGTELVAVEAGGTEKKEAFCINLATGDGQYCLRLSKLRVYGIDFQLFDPRGLYPLADRVSFVFLRSDELPALNGCVAQVENHAQCIAYRSQVIVDADWFISAPSIHLRYYLEEWSDLLLSWVKFFFIPDLQYWRHDELSQYEAFKSPMQKAAEKLDVDQAKQLTFNTIVDRFEEEADQWTAEMSAQAAGGE